MRIGMSIIGIGAGIEPDAIETIAANAERLGFGTLWSPEHIIFLKEFTSKYPYTADGSLPGPVGGAKSWRPAASCTTTV